MHYSYRKPDGVRQSEMDNTLGNFSPDLSQLNVPLTRISLQCIRVTHQAERRSCKEEALRPL